ncbi:cysteine and tyrosine-rich protein 1-like [Mya arenaria]|uniref:cysteine and tyrosine-rich protein 1-like n=1 Tax=Mya arenaria TaxID=6604 RepID=UPI0022E92A71|nr:cysteine and tyrosine-rich protein 1-like [Mya arenaria]
MVIYKLIMLAILFIFSSILTTVSSYDTCYSYGFYTKRCYGDEYCCGTYNDKCCDPATLSTAALVGIVIGGLLVVSVIVTFICVCAKKNQRAQGTVIRPNPEPSIAMVQMYGQGGAFMYPAPGQAQPYLLPPSYNQAQTAGTCQHPPQYTEGFQAPKSENLPPPPMYGP